MKPRCQCYDAVDGHPVESLQAPAVPGESLRCTGLAVCNMKRIDMEDESGTLFCDHCAGDAVESGVYGEPTYPASVR